MKTVGIDSTQQHSILRRIICPFKDLFQVPQPLKVHICTSLNQRLIQILNMDIKMYISDIFNIFFAFLVFRMVTNLLVRQRLMAVCNPSY